MRILTLVLICMGALLGGCNKPPTSVNSANSSRPSENNSGANATGRTNSESKSGERTETTAKPLESPSKETPLSKARKGFISKLTGSGAAPQEYEDEKPPLGVSVVQFKSGEVQLTAWRSELPNDGKKHPALVFAHGGFAFGAGDYLAVAHLVKQGWVVIAPIFRGENGSAGKYDLFLHEIDDLIATGEYVASLDCVNKKQVFAVGHSVGGTRCILAAMLPSSFRATASIGGAPDIRPWLNGQEELAPFDCKDLDEIKVRNPAQNHESQICPLILANGEDETGFTQLSWTFVKQARALKKDVDHFTKPGDHFSCFEGALEEIVKRFTKMTQLDD
jgi:dipeptidyl aminopeptidase/acylaminoacyl peptidase